MKGQRAKTITVSKLEKLGYKLTRNVILFGKEFKSFGIAEVKNEDNRKEVGFCYLFSVISNTGIILPNPFHYYKIRTPFADPGKFIGDLGLPLVKVHN